MAKTKSTYGTISKWFKWSSVIILLVPVVELILIAINVAQKNSVNPDWFNKGMLGLWIINLICALAWLVLNIIMFFAAGTVRNDGPSPALIRLGLFFALVLVLVPIILLIVNYYKTLGDWAYWVGSLVPVAGYILGAVMGSKLQHNLK